METEPRFLVIGEVLKPHGVRGEVRVHILTDLPERFTWLDVIYAGLPNKSPTKMTVDSVRFHKDMVLLKFADYHDRNAVEFLRSWYLYVPESESIPLEEDEYFLYQVVGMQVITLEGELLGQIDSVLETKANNVFVVKQENHEVLLPDIPEVIVDIDFDAGIMKVNLLPGLL